jgi:hypothetical protein
MNDHRLKDGGFELRLKPDRSAHRPTRPISLDCAGDDFGLRQAWLKKPIEFTTGIRPVLQP